MDRVRIPTLLAFSAFLFPLTAEAKVGFGTTLYVGPDFTPVYGDSGDSGFGGVAAWLPSFDLHFANKMSLQIHALDTLAYVLEDGNIIFLGGDFNFP